ncbi:MAG: N,N-dimethylformamidase beta subunit family domain-containing protein [Pseudomonadota bacterium]
MTRLLGYADRLSVAPGENLKVMVSCDGIESYDVSLIRVIQGDINPDGPGYQEERIDIDLGGPFNGRYQPIHTGSYAIVEDAAPLAALASMGLQAFIWPTLPGRGVQTIICREDPASSLGFRLFLDNAGALSFALSGPGQEPIIVSTDQPILAERWYLVGASYDAGSGLITVRQMPLRSSPGGNREYSASYQAIPGLSQSGCTAPLLIAARPANDWPAREHFNGRVEAPMILSRPITAEESMGLTADNASDLVAAWDFSHGISSDRISDLSSNQLHGRLVNLPTRAVPGRLWNGDEHCWTKKPEHYGAIHFHDDDLYDCAWDTDFEVKIPEGMRSAVYALHLQGDGEDYYIAFAVRPPRGTVTAPVAYLMPTASYLAYANNRIGIDVPETEIVAGRLIQLSPLDLFMQEHPELGLCFYDLHNDGSGVYYSSRLRPIVNMQPKHIGHLGGVGSNLWQFNADTHILGWLEQLGQPFDVITDEDLQNDGLEALSGYRAVITGSHPEYYSLGMLDALASFQDQGGRLMYLGGNGFYWRVSYHPTLPGVIECRKSEDGIRAFAPRPGEFYAGFTGEYTGLWRRNGRPPNELVGVGMVSQGFDISAPYVRTAASHDLRAAFIFEGVEGDTIGAFGLSGGGAAGLELDAVDHSLGTPPNTLVLASSRRHTDLYLMTPEDMNDPAPGLGGSEAEIIRADMVFFETTSGGAVFSTGSIAWAGSLPDNNFDNQVAQITTNVLNRFLEPKAFAKLG